MSIQRIQLGLLLLKRLWIQLSLGWAIGKWLTSISGWWKWFLGCIWICTSKLIKFILIFEFAIVIFEFVIVIVIAHFFAVGVAGDLRICGFPYSMHLHIDNRTRTYICIWYGYILWFSRPLICRRYTVWILNCFQKTTLHFSRKGLNAKGRNIWDNTLFCIYRTLVEHPHLHK